MSKRYWSLIDSPFQKFAAWVDEDGRLLRFNLRATGAAKVDPEAENNSRKLAAVQRQVDEYAKGKRREFELELAAEGPEFDKKVWAALMETARPTQELSLEVKRKGGAKTETVKVKLVEIIDQVPTAKELPETSSAKKALTKPGEKVPAKKPEKKPETGQMKKQTPALDNTYYVYVPDNYDANIAYSVQSPDSVLATCEAVAIACENSTDRMLLWT